jgi:hypothetical protein
MKLFLDCEFNEFKGELISMALVAEDGQEFYEVLACPSPGPWVKEHVIPILNRNPVTFDIFQWLLQEFLMRFDRIHIVADWPEDIKHFCDSLITGPGVRLNTPPLTMSIHRFDAESTLPHNALHDARGIMEYWLNNKYN